MKKVSVFLVILLMLINVCGQWEIAFATSSEDIWVVRTTVTQLYENEVVNNRKLNIQDGDCIDKLNMTLSANYIEKVLRCTHEFYINGNLVFEVDETCTVWYYSNGKVHLYRRTLIGNRISDMIIGTITYGSIVNTDGSRSYTSEDKVSISMNTTTKTYALEFYVTENNYRFAVSEID